MAYLSYCGLLCDKCPVYIATAENNQEEKERLAALYTNDFCTFTAADMTCKGCFEPKTLDNKMCGGCVIRMCAEEKKVENCGTCADFPCAITERYVPAGSDHRLRLDYIASRRA